jgi:hypothetical protein
MSIVAVFGNIGNVYPIKDFTVSLYVNETPVASATVATISASGTYTLGNNSINYSVADGSSISLRYTISSGTIPAMTTNNYIRASVGWVPSS